jgi:hypothetical protein
LEATVGQKNEQIDEGVASLEQGKNQNVGWNVTNTKTEYRTGLKLILNM